MSFLLLSQHSTAHDAFTVICDAKPVTQPINLNFKFPIGPRRNPLKPYNHVDCVQEVSVWTNRSTTVQQLHSYHKQGHRIKRENKSMPSSRKKPPPRSSNRKVQKHLDQMTNMAYHQSRAADRVPLARESGTTTKSICTGYLRDLSKGNRANQKVYSVLKDKVKADAPELFSIRNPPAKYDPKDFFPSKAELHLQQQFGKNNELKSYTVLPVLSQIAVIVWKSGYLGTDNKEPETLAKLLPCGEATLSMISNLARVDFSALKLLPFDHDIYNDPGDERRIIINKKVLRNAGLLHYDMDLSAVQRYCGDKWTGEHRRTDQMLRLMSHILPYDLFQELAARLVDNVPNLLNTEIPSEEVASLLTTNNLPTVAKNPELVNNAILKEERNHLLLVFSKHLAYFTPNLSIIKLGILDQKHKKPRMYCHGSYMLEASINPINNLVDCKLSEPAIRYAMVLKRHTSYLWRIASTYPGCTMNSYNDNVSGAFPQ